jgi:hypothetical protein
VDFTTNIAESNFRYTHPTPKHNLGNPGLY